MKRILTITVSMCLLMTFCLGVVGTAAAEGEPIELTLTGIGFNVESGVNPATGEPFIGWQEFADTVVKEAFPNVNLTIESIPWEGFKAKMQTILQSGETDLLYASGAFVASFYEENLLADLTPFIEKDSAFVFDDVYPAGLRNNMNLTDYTTEKLIALPYILGYRLNIYDKVLFDQWGVEYLSEYPTIEEVIDKASRMTGINPVTGEMNYGCYFAGDQANMCYLIEIGYANGVVGCEGTLSDLANLTWSINSPEVVKTLQDVSTLALYCPPGFVNSDGDEFLGKTNNNVAIYLNVSGSKIMNEYNATKDASLLERYVPVYGMGPKGEGWAVADGMAMSTSVDNDKKDIAWEVLKFIAGSVGSEYMYSEFGPMSMAVKEDSFYQDEDIYIRMNSKVIENAHSGLFEELNPFFASDIQPTLASIISLAATGQDVDIQAELDKLQRKAIAWSQMQ